MSGIKFVKQKASQVSTEYDMTFSWSAVCNDLTAVELETSKPSGYTFDFTIDETFLASQVTGKLHPKFLTFTLGLSGFRNSQTVNFELYKNDTSIISSTTTVTDYWSLDFQIFEVKLGDRISVKLWASGVGATYFFNTYMISPMMPNKVKYLVKDFSWTVSSSTLPVYTSSLVTFSYQPSNLEGTLGGAVSSSSFPAAGTTTIYPPRIVQKHTTNLYDTVSDGKCNLYTTATGGVSESYYLYKSGWTQGISSPPRIARPPLRIRLKEVKGVPR